HSSGVSRSKRHLCPYQRPTGSPGDRLFCDLVRPDCVACASGDEWRPTDAGYGVVRNESELCRNPGYAPLSASGEGAVLRHGGSGTRPEWTPESCNTFLRAGLRVIPVALYTVRNGPRWEAL